ncbi:hypothetical protein V8E54_007012 [Elaphomyces granulatus]|jgi:hypothetical protein
MKVSIISTIVATLLAASSAAPVDNARQFQVAITFYGAAGASFTQLFPTDDQPYPITNPLSISQISSVGGGFCTFRGIDGSETVVVGEQTVPVGPPQTQISGVCDIL